jgi:phosphatidate cytidylyltransferase
MKKLITRTLTGIVFVALIVSSLFLNPVFFNILFLTITLLATWEYIQIAEKNNIKPQYTIPFLLNASFFTAFQLMDYSIPVFLYVLLFSLLLIFIIPVVELYRNKENPLINIAASLFPLIWIALPFSIMGMWAHFFNAATTVLALFIIIWAYDTFAYCAGSLFGKHRLWERISPKKSWEGFIISLILTAGGSVAFYVIPFFQNFLFYTPWHWIGFAIVIIMASTFGDLTESLFKRKSGIKDSGNILPGHGGLLDRFDSFFFAAPAAFIYWYVIYLI